MVATDAAGPIHILGSVGHLSSWLKGKDLATHRNDFPLPFTSFLEVEIKGNMNPPNYVPVFMGIFKNCLEKSSTFQ